MLIAPQIKQSSYKRNLINIAKMSDYQSIASIPIPLNYFPYSVKHDQEDRQIEKTMIQNKLQISSNQDKYYKNQIKLDTILQTNGGRPLFPRISQIKSIKGKLVKQSLNLKTKNTQNSISLDSRQQTQSSGVSNLIDLVQSRKINNQQIKKQMFPLVKQNKRQNNVNKLIIKKQIQQDEQSQSQYEYDAVPGPGSYNFRYSQFDKKTSLSTNVSFLSKSSRFQYIKDINIKIQKNENPQIQQNNNRKIFQIKKIAKLRQKIIPFGSLSPKILKLSQKQSIIPGPQYYYPRYGIEQQLIKKIQKNLRGGFNSEGQRFEKSKEQKLGPGSYMRYQEREEWNNNESYFFKSNSPRIK